MTPEQPRRPRTRPPGRLTAALLAPRLSPLASALGILTSAFCALSAPILAQPITDSAPPVDTASLSQEIRANQASLDRTRQQLADLQAELDKLGEQEKATLARIASYDQQIGVIARYLRELDAQTAARTREIAAVAGEVQRTTSEIDTRRATLGRRLTAMYKYGRTLPLEAMLSRRTLPEVYRRLTYMRWFARQDEKLARDLAALNEQLLRQQARIAAAREALGRLQDEQRSQQAALGSAQSAERAVLKKVQSQRSDREALAAQLEESSRRLQSLIADLERKRSEARVPAGQHYFERNKGRLPWPVTGKLISTFGAKVHPRYRTRTSNLGIDIQTASPSEVSCIAAGRVVYAEQFMGYGNLVIADHDAGFYTLYSNLVDMLVKVGDDVLPGTAVGRIDDYLHFEIRRDGKPVDPTPWLKAR
jgi:septal ring factor EnvC (AmiA/AmiB activator)